MEEGITVQLKYCAKDTYAFCNKMHPRQLQVQAEK